ncbi:hypothetical protein [Candidatus Deianiraea vastatrix]|uniref:Uncharacterized protein n=1 Tax=Candidatus Deianiraea vastatrix TaxID=2163644 RepID=A0A5B8XE49_9RICK|nr:hypothetical protein [Candidatus Deianiraea vastatrix]QED23588.1 hypothetical protein Deia_00800 [Candidatus Deianiraea vastatrix]
MPKQKGYNNAQRQRAIKRAEHQKQKEEQEKRIQEEAKLKEEEKYADYMNSILMEILILNSRQISNMNTFKSISTTKDEQDSERKKTLKDGMTDLQCNIMQLVINFTERALQISNNATLDDNSVKLKNKIEEEFSNLILGKSDLNGGRTMDMRNAMSIIRQCHGYVKEYLESNSVIYTVLLVHINRCFCELCISFSLKASCLDNNQNANIESVINQNPVLNNKLQSLNEISKKCTDLANELNANMCNAANIFIAASMLLTISEATVRDMASILVKQENIKIRINLLMQRNLGHLF